MGAKFDITNVFEYFVKLLPFIQISLLIVAGSILVGLGVGFLVALPRLYRIPVLQRISQVYASFFRGTPILIQLFLFYYGLPEILKAVNIDVSRISVMYFVILTYGLHSAAYVSEGIRAAVTAVDRGQIEAAYSAGMTGFQAFTRIVFPQALAVAIPILGNVIIATLKDTSLAFTLGVMELTSKAQSLGQLNRHFIESYIALALIYLLMSLVLEQIFLAIERRLLRHESRDGVFEKIPLGRKWLKRRFASNIRLDKGGSGV
ncbi:amino acid ABC transporter permease [Cohnella herbarum]|uniref:Amino acid ABC transporter permease n=1 Tax=Cohnella herbarum TaxID=2728023 RepID=A0A7Z2VQN2_9BACL|nr:amino acid ABC transporter permease [Cohnella herbarum]QJD87678.1 amino acid ABC transporter permease [Cohnella herbarum]